ncbi:MAG: PAS domain S-box protein [Gemmatimonadales bacterium]|nr:PAS domain S-box protein [Gemmatimonadales bacterium]
MRRQRAVTPRTLGAAIGEWQALLAQRTEQLEASEERFLALIARTRDGVVIVDHVGTIRFTNPAAEALLGKSRAELLGGPLGCPVVADETVELDIQRAGAEPVIAEMRVAETKWEGRPAFLCALRDVTERVRQLDALQRLVALHTAILDAMPGRVVLVAPDGMILYANAAWLHRLGRGIGTDYFQMLAGDPAVADPARAAAGVREVLRGAAPRFASATVSAAAVVQGPRPGAVVLHTDAAG